MSKIHSATDGTLRVKLSAHSTTISNIVLLGYHKLSDGAKLTYMVLESYDWPDESGLSKGKCWPSIETLALARGKSYDTVARHLKELEAVGLIRVESGQERGASNCYWLLEPAVEEAETYYNRYSKKASQLSETKSDGKDAQPVPQSCNSSYRKIAEPGPADLPDKEPERFKEPEKKESKKERDSNRKIGQSFAARGSVSGGHPQSGNSYLSRLMDDFSRMLNDTTHAASNRTQALNLYNQSGMDEQHFAKLLYEAKKRTQWAAVADGSTTRQGPNRAAYFFTVVRDLLAQQTDQGRARTAALHSGSATRGVNSYNPALGI